MRTGPRSDFGARTSLFSPTHIWLWPTAVWIAFVVLALARGSAAYLRRSAFNTALISRFKTGTVVALGATAARGMLGRTVSIAKVGGEILSEEASGSVLVTIHPSYLLRIQSHENQAEKADAHDRFVKDLRVCAKALHDSKQNPAVRRQTPSSHHHR